MVRFVSEQKPHVHILVDVEMHELANRYANPTLVVRLTDLRVLGLLADARYNICGCMVCAHTSSCGLVSRWMSSHKLISARPYSRLEKREQL